MRIGRSFWGLPVVLLCALAAASYVARAQQQSGSPGETKEDRPLRPQESSPPSGPDVDRRIGRPRPGAVAAPAAQPGPVGEPEGEWRAQIHWIPMTEPEGGKRLLQGRVCRPKGDAPGRVAVIAHGSPVSPAERERMVLGSCGAEAARWFLDRGYVVIYSLRRGYGATGGTRPEDDGPCRADRDYTRSGLESARDLGATVDYATALSFARPDGAVVVGHSAGGWATIAYDTLEHPRVAGLINMAGGRGGRYGDRANSNCEPEQLVKAAGQFGAHATTPMLWVYNANDSFFSPDLAKAMYQAFAKAGGAADYEALPAFGRDGHLLFFSPGGSAIWGPLFERYLAARGLSGG